jgi:hypothetical protein
MARNDNPWQQVAAMTGIAHRITTLERLHDRVAQLERGSRAAPERRG